MALVRCRGESCVERDPRPRLGVDRDRLVGSASEHSATAANPAIRAFDGDGCVLEYPVRTSMRDARVMTLYEGTSQIQKLLIGRAETGISAFL